MADICVKAVNTKKEVSAGIRTGNISIALESDKKEKEVVFEFPGTALPMAKGFDVEEASGRTITKSGAGLRNMKNRTNLKAGGIRLNNNETLVKDPQAAGLKIKTRIRGGMGIKRA